MTIALDELVTQEVRRNQWGQYLVVPPGKRKPVGYPRATTIAKGLDTSDSLLGHYQRHTAMGLKLRPDLWAQVPTSFDDDTKRPFTKLCDEAHDAGGGNARRDRGTAIHDALEQYVRTGRLPVDVEMSRNVVGVDLALEDAGFEIVPDYVEAMVVLDAFRIAGRMDMVLRHTDGTLYVGDLKTGSSVNYGQLAWACQLAIYANADNIYEQGPATDGSEDVRHPMPDVDKARAVIVHLNEDTDACDVYWLDIAAGREALDVAMSVRGMKKRKGLLVPVAQGGTDSTTEPVVVGSVDRPSAGRPARIEPTSTHVDKPDEGGPADPSDYAELQAVGNAAPKDVKQLVLRWRSEPKGYWRWGTAGDDGKVSVRRVAINRCALELAAFVVETMGPKMNEVVTTYPPQYPGERCDDTARAALEEVLGDDVQSHGVGQLLSRMTPDECRRMREVLK
jgi:hypothetical protein